MGFIIFIEKAIFTLPKQYDIAMHHMSGVFPLYVVINHSDDVKQYHGIPSFLQLQR